jgi:signal transduction histidine kinase
MGLADGSHPLGAAWQTGDDASLSAICRVGGAAWVLVWDAAGRAVAGPNVTFSLGAVTRARAAFADVGESMAVDASHAGAQALLASVPARGSLLYVPVGKTAGGMVLGFAKGRGVTPGLDLEAFGRLVAAATRFHSSEEFAMEVARLATAGRIAAGFAHDIGTPLNIISGYAEFLLMSAAPETPTHKGLGAILDQTRRIAQMIRHMLDVVRPPKGRALQQQPLEEFVGEVMHFASYTLRKLDVKGQIDKSVGWPGAVVGDLHGLRNALFNILSGAARLVGPGGRLLLQPAPNDRAGTGVELEGVSAAGERVDFNPLVEAAPDDAAEYLEMMLVRSVLAWHCGGLELADGNGGADGTRVVVRLVGDESRKAEKGTVG